MLFRLVRLCWKMNKNWIQLNLHYIFLFYSIWSYYWQEFLNTTVISTAYCTFAPEVTRAFKTGIPFLKEAFLFHSGKNADLQPTAYIVHALVSFWLINIYSSRCFWYWPRGTDRGYGYYHKWNNWGWSKILSPNSQLHLIIQSLYLSLTYRYRWYSKVTTLALLEHVRIMI